MSEQTIEYIVRVHQEDDSLWAEVLDLPGCFASGHTLDELREALEEAISLYVTDDPDAGKISSLSLGSDPPRHPLQVGEMRVKVPA